MTYPQPRLKTERTTCDSLERLYALIMQCWTVTKGPDDGRYELERTTLTIVYAPPEDEEHAQ